jgi:hypothetical protein
MLDYLFQDASNIWILEPTFLQSVRRAMEAFFPAGWFDNPQHASHPAYQHWSLCSRLIAPDGIIRVSQQQNALPAFTRMMLDSINYVEVTQGDSQRLVPGPPSLSWDTSS